MNLLQLCYKQDLEKATIENGPNLKFCSLNTENGQQTDWPLQ